MVRSGRLRPAQEGGGEGTIFNVPTFEGSVSDAAGWTMIAWLPGLVSRTSNIAGVNGSPVSVRPRLGMSTCPEVSTSTRTVAGWPCSTLCVWGFAPLRNSIVVGWGVLTPGEDAFSVGEGAVAAGSVVSSPPRSGARAIVLAIAARPRTIANSSNARRSSTGPMVLTQHVRPVQGGCQQRG